MFNIRRAKGKAMASLISTVFISIVCYPTSFGPPRELQVVSSDNVYRIRVIPPYFKRHESYIYFQKQDFMSLTISEGGVVASNAVVHLVLSRLGEKGIYFNVWSRSTTSTIIPTTVHLLTVKNSPAIIIEGQYMSVDLQQIPFAIYSLSGRCLTNGTFDAAKEYSLFDSSKTNWIVDGTNVCLIARDGEVVKKIPVEY